jgi:phosphomannomutase / phosphoglucomutase
VSNYNSADYFSSVLIDPLGFREYDVRWIIEPVGDKDAQINYRGMQQLGYWLGRFLQQDEIGGHEQIVVGHDFRKYSENVKNALTVGLLASGINVTDIGLTVSPGTYFAQYAYKIPACAMVTASHNPNGWTGVKIGYGYSKTLQPQHINAFKDYIKELVATEGEVVRTPEKGGSYAQVTDANERYIADLVETWKPRLDNAGDIKVAVETGNGTAGLFMMPLLEKLGFNIVPGHVEPDWDFPHFNPNPENVTFLKAVRTLVTENDADIGLCLDGDGDRIGLVDDRGRLVFSDRAGLLISRQIEEDRKAQGLEGTRFVVDVKSTSLYEQVLESPVVWEKTGHSYIKAAVAREQAAGGFERSGHFFLNAPFGRGYDDGCVAAMMLLWITCEARKSGRKISDILDTLPPSHQSPNRQPLVPEARKYEIVDEIQARIEKVVRETGEFAGQEVAGEPMTVNGIRVNMKDGSWLLVRASSNTPNLVIIAESFDADGALLERMDRELRELIKDIDGIGEFDSLKSDL